MMIDDAGGSLYPDSPQDAAFFAIEHGARFTGECPGVEQSPNPCTCSCYGCQFHCGACWRKRMPGEAR